MGVITVVSSATEVCGVIIDTRLEVEARIVLFAMGCPVVNTEESSGVDTDSVLGIERVVAVPCREVKSGAPADTETNVCVFNIV